MEFPVYFSEPDDFRLPVFHKEDPAGGDHRGVPLHHPEYGVYSGSVGVIRRGDRVVYTGNRRNDRIYHRICPVEIF